MANKDLLRVKFEGAQDLEAALRELGNNRSIRKALGQALLIAGEPAAKMARSLAPVRRPGGGELAEGIDISTTLSRRQRRARGYNSDPTEAYVFIGAQPRGPAVIQEFGTAARHTKTGKSTGISPPHPFMRPAWEANKVQILETFAKLLWVTIQAEAERLARKQASLIRKGKSR